MNLLSTLCCSLALCAQNSTPDPTPNPTTPDWWANVVVELALRNQDPAPTPKPPAPQVEPVPAQVALPELLPGAIPESSTAQARALWIAIRDSTAPSTAPNAPQAKVNAFELIFEGEASDAQGNQTTFNGGRIRFLAPGFVDSSFEKKGRRRLRGPKGDWMVDASGQKFSLGSIEMEHDRRELDSIAHVARTFANLIDSKNLRLRSIATMNAPPFAIPSSLLERAKTLKWIEVTSPDFAMLKTDGRKTTRDVRAWIGADPVTHRPSLAMVAEDDRGTIVHESALLVALETYKPLDGYQVPTKLQTYAPDFSVAPWTFSTAPRLQLWLLEKCTLRATFTAKDFEP